MQLQDYQNYNLFREDLVARLNTLLENTEVESNRYQEAEIFEVTRYTDLNGVPEVYVDVSTKTGIVTVCLRKAIELGNIILPEEKVAEYNSLIADYDKAKSDNDVAVAEKIRELNERAAEQRKIRAEKLAKLQAEKEARELVEKQQKKIQNEIKKFNDLKSSKIHINFEMRDTFYYNIGWCAKHITTISAAMPDFLESYFVGVFGDVKRRVVDSKKVGPAGYTSQWSLSMTAALDTVDNIPPTLTAYMSKGKNKVLSKLSFVYMLCEEYGFKFGSEQDIEAIRKEIPEKHLAEFEAGYND